jgi:hypothetical protein
VPPCSPSFATCTADLYEKPGVLPSLEAQRQKEGESRPGELLLSRLLFGEMYRLMFFVYVYFRAFMCHTAVFQNRTGAF